MRAMQNETNLPPDIRLSSLSHGGGCGCKMSPAVLQGIMASMPAGVLPPQLLVGTESSDDAAVYQINATQALVATTVAGGVVSIAVTELIGETLPAASVTVT